MEIYNNAGPYALVMCINGMHVKSLPYFFILIKILSRSKFSIAFWEISHVKHKMKCRHAKCEHSGWTYINSSITKILLISYLVDMSVSC